MNSAPPAPTWARPSLLGRIQSWATVANPVARWAVIGVAIVAAIGWIGFATQTIRLEGAQLRLPFIGSIGPQGWKPYAEELKDEVVEVTLQRDQANANHRKTKLNYRSAQKQAQVALEEENERIETEHKEEIRAIENRHRVELAGVRDREQRMRDAYFRARTDAERLADEAREADFASAGEAAEATGCYGVSGRRPYLVQIRCDRIATEQAAQLKALQETVEAWPDLEVIDEE